MAGKYQAVFLVGWVALFLSSVAFSDTEKSTERGFREII